MTSCGSSAIDTFWVWVCGTILLRVFRGLVRPLCTANSGGADITRSMVIGNLPIKVIRCRENPGKVSLALLSTNITSGT